MIRTQDLTDVVYASGSVFNGLSTNRLDTRNFLATGSTEGVTSRADLALLQDLKDVAHFVITHTAATVDADYVIAVNSLITRSGAIAPGRLRDSEDRIGVDTRYGRHEPGPMTHAALNTAITQAISRVDDPIDQASTLFVAVSAAQPFMDGNKRTAIFAAEGHLLHLGSPQLLSLPTRDQPGGSEAVEQFNDLLARAYVFEDVEAVTQFLRHYTVNTPGQL